MADETKGVQKDALPERGQPSAEDKGIPSQEPKTYTQDEVEKLLSERHSKLDKEIAKLGKDKQTMESRAKALEDDVFNLKETLTEIERLKEEAEIAAAEGNPDAMKRIRRERAIRDLEAKAKQDKTEIEKERTDIQRERDELAEDKKAISEFRRAQLLSRIASKYELTSEQIDKPYLETEESLEDFARTLSGKAAVVSGTKLDSGVTTGRTKDLSTPDAKLMEGFRKLKQ